MSAIIIRKIKENTKMDGTVTIPVQRYTELIETETRVNFLVETYARNDCVKKEDALWMLGTEFAIELALELKHKNEEAKKKRNEDMNYDE